MLILFLFLTLPPASAQGTDSSKHDKPFELNASRNRLLVDPQWVNSDEEDKMLPDKLTPLIPGHTNEDGQIQETSVSKVLLEENHGEIAVGVLGAYTADSDGTITKILPGSDLIRLGIKVGDRIKKINGTVFANHIQFRNACRGLPNTTMILTIEHRGSIKTYEVKRTDARLYAKENEDDYYSWCVKQIKRW